MGEGDGGRRDGSLNGRNQSRASKGYGVYFGGKTDKSKVEGEKKKKKQKRSQSEGDSAVTLQEQNETK